MKKKGLLIFVTMSLIVGMLMILSCQRGSGTPSPAPGSTTAQTEMTAALPNTNNLSITGNQRYNLRIASGMAPTAFGSLVVEKLNATLVDWSEGRISLQ